MRIALASAKVIDRDITFNLSQMDRYMQEAKHKDADLICFGESYLQGFNALTWCYEKDKNMGVSTKSPVFEELYRKSLDYGIDILFGYIERDGELLYSSCALISEGKICHNYRRISKGWKEYWKTDDHYTEGDTVSVFDYHGKRCTIGLCGDLWDYPERFALGEDILFWPVYCGWTEAEWYDGRECDNYARQANLCCANTLYIDSVCDGEAFGGAFWFAGGKMKEQLPIGCEDLLYVDI